jgi:hypothetical protein
MARVVFLGSDRWSVPSLEALAESTHDVSLAATRVPKPAGRGSKLTPTPVADAARALGLPLAEVPTARSGAGFERLREARPDILVVVAYGEILPAAALDLAAIAPVNLHFSLLPELRGAAPVQRALLEGMTATGVTTIRMDEGLDTGPILLQAEEAIDPEDDAGSLGGRLAGIGGRLLVDTIDRTQALRGGSMAGLDAAGGGAGPSGPGPRTGSGSLRAVPGGRAEGGPGIGSRGRGRAGNDPVGGAGVVPRGERRGGARSARGGARGTKTDERRGVPARISPPGR